MTDIPKSHFTKAKFLFNQFIRNYKKKKELSSDSPINWNKLSDDDFKEIYKASYIKLRQVLEPILSQEPDDKEILPFLYRLMKLIPSYYPNYPIRQAIILKNLKQEVLFGDTDHDKFWVLSKETFMGWLGACHKNKLRYNTAKVFLAWLWVLENFNVHQNKEKLITVSTLVRVSGLGDKPVNKNLKFLKERGLIIFRKKEKRFFAKSLPIALTSNLVHDIPSKTPLISEIDINFRLDNLQTYKYLYQQPLNKHNPFFFSDPTRFVVHLGLLNMEAFLVSVLSRDDFLKLIAVDYNRKSAIKAVSSRKEKISNFFKTLVYTTPNSLDPHYRLLFDIVPALHYISRRKFEVDPDKLLHQIYYTKYRIEAAQKRFREMYKKAAWDVNYFLKCLKKLNSTEQWLKKYKMQDIKLEHRTLSVSLDKYSPKELEQLMKDDKYEVPLHSMDDSINIPSALPLNLDRVELKRIVKEEWHGAQDLLDIKKFSTSLSQLNQISDRIQRDNTLSITSTPSIIDNRTHRLILRDFSSQNIQKINRPIFKARRDHQFLFVDIAQEELSIIKWYASKYFGDNSDKKLSDLNFDSISDELEIKRDYVKTMFYIWSYGGGLKAMQEIGLTVTHVKKFTKYISSNPALQKLTNEVKQQVIENFVTPSTPLGHQFPIFKALHGLPILIQATAAEIMALWIQELDNFGLLQYIVNVIHDEIIFELPTNFNVYEISNKITETLNKTTTNLLPYSHLKPKFSTSPYWDITNSSIIHPT